MIRATIYAVAIFAAAQPAAAQEDRFVAANKAVARRFLEAIPAANAEVIRSVWAPDAVLTLKVAGIYSPELQAMPDGTQWDRDGIVAMERDFLRQFSGPFTLEIQSMIGEGDFIAAEVVGRGVSAANGRQYLQHFSYHFEIRKGRIADGRVYEDTFHTWDVRTNAAPAAPPWPKVAANTATESAPKSSRAPDVARNKATVRRFLMAVQTRNAKATQAAWAEGGVWSFAVGGAYVPAAHAFENAPSWNRDGMIRMQQNGQGGLKEPLTIDIYSLIGQGDEVSAEAVGFMVRPDGHAYRQHYSIHFHLRDRKLVEGHVYQDTLHQYDLARHRDNYAPVAASGGER